MSIPQAEQQLTELGASRTQSQPVCAEEVSGACFNAEAEEVCTSAAFYHWQCQASQVKGICRNCAEKVGQKGA